LHSHATAKPQTENHDNMSGKENNKTSGKENQINHSSAKSSTTARLKMAADARPESSALPKKLQAF